MQTMTRRQRRQLIAEREANAPEHTRYICKNCGRPSPAGIGYAADGWGFSCITEANDNCGPNA